MLRVLLSEDRGKCDTRRAGESQEKGKPSLHLNTSIFVNRIGRCAVGPSSAGHAQLIMSMETVKEAVWFPMELIGMALRLEHEEAAADS